MRFTLIWHEGKQETAERAEDDASATGRGFSVLLHTGEMIADFRFEKKLTVMFYLEAIVWQRVATRFQATNPPKMETNATAENPR